MECPPLLGIAPSWWAEKNRKGGKQLLVRTVQYSSVRHGHRDLRPPRAASHLYMLLMQDSTGLSDEMSLVQQEALANR